MALVFVGVSLIFAGLAIVYAGLWDWGGGVVMGAGLILGARGVVADMRERTQIRTDVAEQTRAREQAEAELDARSAERDQLQRALDAAGDLVIALDADARIRYLNPAAERTLRLPDPGDDRDLLGAPLLDIVVDPDLYDAVRLAADEGTPAVMVVLRAERRFRTVVAPVSQLAESGPWSVVLAMHDLTDLYEAETARRDFFINASHELRTPLASISAAAETLALVNEPDDASRFRAIIQSESERMGQLVEEMLALARLESGLTEPAMEVVPIESLLRDAVEVFRPQAEREGLALRCRLNGTQGAAGETMIAADPELVERALLNLLHNAVKFTDAGGEIEVFTEREEQPEPAAGAGMLWVRVRDSGIGVEPTEQPRIFQRFYRVDRARQSGGGTGLGLAVVRHIAEVHGGGVSLDSEPGAGSTFGFSVPLAPQS